MNNHPSKFHFQLVITTHSPFLLSDVSENEVILLSKTEPEAGSKDTAKTVQIPNHQFQTFGANIHELLANSFFLQNGTIGDFAIVQIQQVIDRLNDWKSNIQVLTQVSKNDRQKTLNLILIIADSLVRNKLLDMFYSIFPDEDFKKQEINKLKERLDKLTNSEGDDRN